jgi:hypothetical protein
MDVAIIATIVGLISGLAGSAATYLIARDKNRTELVVDDRSGDRDDMRAFYADLRAELAIERAEKLRLVAENTRLQLVLAGYQDVSERAIARLEQKPGVAVEQHS